MHLGGENKGCLRGCGEAGSGSCWLAQLVRDEGEIKQRFIILWIFLCSHSLGTTKGSEATYE